ncbi:MAG: hypothetical protein IKE61_01745 [Coriobacteriales bacterium]|nr:hypothetical protein [Coriobacteriales bacterium]
MERAKELYLHYCGNRYFMALDGDEVEYDMYHVSKETEETWRKEFLDGFFAQKPHGKDALASYSQATEFMKGDRSDWCWEEVLHYPFRSDWLDDVTILFMLQRSFRLGERWARKGKLSREAAAAYLQELDAFSQEVQQRAENGTLSRAGDYDRLEFADPTHVADYMESLRRSWAELV